MIVRSTRFVFFYCRFSYAEMCLQKKTVFIMLFIGSIVTELRDVDRTELRDVDRTELRDVDRTEQRVVIAALHYHTKNTCRTVAILVQAVC